MFHFVDLFFSLSCHYAISEDKRVPKQRVKQRWYCCVAVHKSKKKKTWIGMCSSIYYQCYASSIEPTLYWVTLYHNCQQDLMSWCWDRQATQNTTLVFLLLPFATMRLWTVSLIRWLCLLHFKTEGGYLYICKWWFILGRPPSFCWLSVDLQ